MKQYLLRIYQPDGDIPGPEVSDVILACAFTIVTCSSDGIGQVGCRPCAGGWHQPV